MTESHAAFWLFLREHNGGGLTCLPTQVWHYCTVFAAGLENFFCSNYKLNIMSLHKCLHGQILMNNFPPAFITRLCRKVLYVYWPSDAMGWARSLWLFKQFLVRSIIYLFCLSLTERERCSERFVFLCSLLEIESWNKASFLVTLVGSLFVWSVRCVVPLCVCPCVREGAESSSPILRERKRE